MLKLNKNYKPYDLKWFELHAVDHCNLNCLNCNHHSLFFKKKEYSCEQYFPWIDEMKRRDISFQTIGIIGGEPFLHSDLEGFCEGIKNRYKCRVIVTTNGFWLKNWKKNQSIIQLLDEIIFSVYAPIASVIDFAKLVEEISSFSPKTKIKKRDNITHFSEIKFTSKPEVPSDYCDWQADCTNLLVDGKLARCGVGAYAKANPSATKEFLTSSNSDMFYDLSKDNGRDFKKWKEKYPLEACKFCTMWKKNMVPWQNGARK